MNRFVLIVATTLVGAALALPGCSLFKSSGGTLAVDVGALAACIIQHVENDSTPTFEGIAEECSGVAISDVVAVVAALQVTPDSGPSAAAPSTKAALVHHRAK
jgi:hypothetical protein